MSYSAGGWRRCSSSAAPGEVVLHQPALSHRRPAFEGDDRHDVVQHAAAAHAEDHGDHRAQHQRHGAVEPIRDQRGGEEVVGGSADVVLHQGAAVLPLSDGSLIEEPEAEPGVAESRVTHVQSHLVQSERRERREGSITREREE
ncbi:hypothetical protein F7725_021343 [Dissostichus mawsoni]|uniref:Uncharacterized protein n=1 Tax=Dissostichus mawsoni TaxID=36200 RepID=A0A7J5YFW6_DISMA|nr:hypothetical protein F7725_021343 [Dissostichus mawsoni]